MGSWECCCKVNTFHPPYGRKARQNHYLSISKPRDRLFVTFIHDRMPLILPEEFVGEWIKPETRPEELVKEAQTEMYFEKA